MDVASSESLASHLSFRNGAITSPNVPQSEPLKDQVRHYIACVVSGECAEESEGDGKDCIVPCQSSGHDGLAVVRILEAAEISMAKGGQPIDL